MEYVFLEALGMVGGSPSRFAGSNSFSAAISSLVPFDQVIIPGIRAPGNPGCIMLLSVELLNRALQRQGRHAATFHSSRILT